MLLRQPFIIGPRLMAAVVVGNATISIGYAKRPGCDGRVRYEWFFDAPGIEETGDDLQSGCFSGSIRDGMSSLLSFLSACGESYRYAGNDGDNSELFPESMREWCAANRDELSILQSEIDESAECCVE